jgi:hypothetical protein
VPIDPNSLPQDPAILKQMLVDVTAQLDKTQRLLRQLLVAKTGVRSEQLSADQLRLFAQELGVGARSEATKKDDDADNEPRQSRTATRRRASRAAGALYPRI